MRARIAGLLLIPTLVCVAGQATQYLHGVFTENHQEPAEKLAAGISAEKLSEFHRMVTRAPHIAGTPGGRAVATGIEQQLKSFGLVTERSEYQAYLSHPRRIRLTQFAPVQRALAVTEPSDAQDPATADLRLTPGFVAYSASGRVRGPVVYVNYGLPADYDALEAAGVSWKGAIALARYGKVHRAVKVHTAETRGAIGILIYSDPADDGFAKGVTWPDGPWRTAGMLQRGNAKYSWYWHGDPLTPLRGATPDAPRQDAAQAPTLPRIPAVALSWGAAKHLLSELGGGAAPTAFQGALGFTYRTGPGRAAVEMDVQMDNGLKPLVNVLARIEGGEDSDRWVILGTHHDAWTFGGVDPGSSCAALLELARVFGVMQRAGWKPRRTIVLAFWDAEEYGLVGSTEYAEEHAAELREKAVAYINSDLYLAGYLKAGGTPSLRNAVAEAARKVKHPTGSGNLYDAWRAREWRKLSPLEKSGRQETFEVELEPLGSGADFVPFQTFLGLPTLSLEFAIEGSFGGYHSSYDSRFYFEKFGDPGWKYGRALTELLGRVALRLADDEIVPLRLSETARSLESYLHRVEAANLDAEGRPVFGDLGLKITRTELKKFAESAGRLEAALRAGRPIANLRELNDRLTQAEKSFVTEETISGPPHWYRHTLYGWDIYALYAGQTLPGLQRALRERDSLAWARERRRLEGALRRATEEVDAAGRLTGAPPPPAVALRELPWASW